MKDLVSYGKGRTSFQPPKERDLRSLWLNSNQKGRTALYGSCIPLLGTTVSVAGRCCHRREQNFQRELFERWHAGPL